MTRQYDNKLRAKVIAHIESGNSICDTARFFKLSSAGIRHWYKSYKATGSMEAKARGGSNNKRSMVDVNALKNYINENPEKTRAQLAKYFNVTVIYITQKINKLKREGIL
jgi:transposase